MSILANLFVKKVNELIPAAPSGKREVSNFIQSNTIRSCEVECLYAEVRYKFKTQMQEGKLARWNILEIRRYLERNVNMYEHNSFKNDCHAIYTMLKAKDITTNDLNAIDKMLRK